MLNDGKANQVGITATHTIKLNVFLMSTRVGSKRNLNPNYITNIL